MDTIITELLRQGPLGLIAGIFIYLYFNERAKTNDLQAKLHEAQKHHYTTIDKVRESQIKREQEVAGTFEEYGKGVIQAVHSATFVAEELRRVYDRRK